MPVTGPQPPIDGTTIGSALPRDLDGACDRLVRAVLRMLMVERSGDAPRTSSWTAAQVGYARDEIALAARDFFHVIDALPDGRQPYGWRPDQEEDNHP